MWWTNITLLTEQQLSGSIFYYWNKYGVRDLAVCILTSVCLRFHYDSCEVNRSGSFSHRYASAKKCYAAPRLVWSSSYTFFCVVSLKRWSFSSGLSQTTDTYIIADNIFSEFRSTFLYYKWLPHRLLITAFFLPCANFRAKHFTERATATKQFHHSGKRVL